MTDIPKADDADLFNRSVYLIEIETESGCSIEKGEYSIRIVYIVRGSVGSDDFGLVEECVAEEIRGLALPDEGRTPFIARETGEREDVFWNKYFVLERV